MKLNFFSDIYINFYVSVISTNILTKRSRRTDDSNHTLCAKSSRRD